MTTEKKEKVDRNVIIPEAPRDRSKPKHVKKQKGIPVPAGCTFQDLSTQQRVGIMDKHENAWKIDYNKRKSTIDRQVTISRG